MSLQDGVCVCVFQCACACFPSKYIDFDAHNVLGRGLANPSLMAMSPFNITHIKYLHCKVQNGSEAEDLSSGHPSSFEKPSEQQEGGNSLILTTAVTEKKGCA